MDGAVLGVVEVVPLVGVGVVVDVYVAGPVGVVVDV